MARPGLPGGWGHRVAPQAAGLLLDTCAASKVQLSLCHFSTFSRLSLFSGYRCFQWQHPSPRATNWTLKTTETHRITLPRPQA